MRNKTLLFLLAVLVQVIIVAAVPARQIFTRLTGTTIRIITAPVDPYDFLSGYHVVLRYEISNMTGNSISYELEERTVYTILEKGPDNIWSRTSITVQPPKDLAGDTIFLKGKVQLKLTPRFRVRQYRYSWMLRLMVIRCFYKCCFQIWFEIEVEVYVAHMSC